MNTEPAKEENMDGNLDGQAGKISDIPLENELKENAERPQIVEAAKTYNLFHDENEKTLFPISGQVKPNKKIPSDQKNSTVNHIKYSRLSKYSIIWGIFGTLTLILSLILQTDILTITNSKYKKSSKNTRIFENNKKTKDKKSKIFPQGRKINIKWGDTLSKISKKVYGQPKYWPYIYFNNKKTITGPDRLVPGTDLIYISFETNGNLGELYYKMYIYYKSKDSHRRLKMLELAQKYNYSYVMNRKERLTELEKSYLGIRK